MIIDQLSEISTVQDTDEIPIERGTTTYKSPLSKIWARLTTAFGSNVLPNMDGTAAIGSSDKYARADHVHPHDTNKQNVLTFDNAPTQNSANPVKSGGVFSAIADSMILGQMVSDYIPSTSDLNDYTTPGFYRTGGTIPAHAPTGTTYHILWVLIVGTTRLQFLLNSSAFYVRTGNSSNWYAWYKFTGSQT